MSRIKQCFELLARAQRKGLIPYITAGDPSLALTLPLMHALVEAGADVIELGIPFSDPMADGPVIQRASERALLNGVTLDDVLQTVAQFRQTNITTPVVLMGYANPIERMGTAVFADRARAVGVDGVLVVDYPPEECADFAATLRAHNIDPIFLLAPTSTDDRIAQIGKIASGYVYYVSLKGVTGSGALDLAEVAQRIPKIKQRTNLPVGVGFGIRDGATARAIGAQADAVVIGSRIIQEIEQAGAAKAVEAVKTFVSGIRTALDTK
ncbi:MAG: tryptophan synthase subunit alpha [Burkholderiaceae bacterium]|nr:MAG: tryptophan synthase subunit alpha [Burkholderiaceae bacterium]